MIGLQFTEKLRAQHYFASERLPGGGSGIQSGTGYALLMSPDEMWVWFGSEPPSPPPEPSDAEKLKILWNHHKEEGLWP